MKKFSKKNLKNIKKINKSKKLFYKLVSKNVLEINWEFILSI